VNRVAASSLCCLLLPLGGLLLVSRPSTLCRGTLADLQSDAACLLRTSDCVERVEQLVSPPHPTHRIIHVANIHVVDFDDFVLDVRDEYGDTVTDAEIAADYEEWLAITRRVQASQRALLRGLIRDHGADRVYCEGLTDADMPAYGAIIRALSNGARDPSTPALMRLGAAGQLLIVGELREVLPAEDEAAYLVPVGKPVIRRKAKAGEAGTWDEDVRGRRFCASELLLWARWIANSTPCAQPAPRTTSVSLRDDLQEAGKQLRQRL